MSTDTTPSQPQGRIAETPLPKPDVLTFFDQQLGVADPNAKLTIFHAMEIYRKMSELAQGGQGTD